MHFDTIPIVRSPLLSQFPRLVHGMSTVQGAEPDAGFAFNPDVRAIGRDPYATQHITAFLDRFSLKPTQLAVMHQVHGTTVHEVSAAGMYNECDGLMTGHSSIALGVRTADCVPVLLYAPVAPAIAAVHSGWKGTAEHICAEAVRRMTSQYNFAPSDIFAWLGPSAGACCYEVGEDVAGFFEPDQRIVTGDGKIHVDLRAACYRDLTAAGVPAANIDSSTLCTICHPSLFHSNRRDAEHAGRMMAIIGLREEPD
jgi:YfiH family protein